MTSGNVSDEPIAYEDEERCGGSAGIADAFLVHDRPIQTRTDDSVVRAVARRGPLLLRRSRGLRARERWRCRVRRRAACWPAGPS